MNKTISLEEMELSDLITLSNNVNKVIKEKQGVIIIWSVKNDHDHAIRSFKDYIEAAEFLLTLAKQY